uniref:Uncharacterized protein n=1 Tax=Meloidogyne enterolobii TaxID=390850 RepID=A0A6V7Y111_MELEN|nr:unnamed protein product [Meloidogyne enterolobii]
MLETSEQQVSLAEVLEVRGAQLTEFEILIILLTASDYLFNFRLVEDKDEVFTLNQILITSDGQIKIQFIPFTEVPSEYIPPELNGATSPFNSESRIVWCLGNCCILCLSSEHSDVALLSLLNLMTLEHPQSRPSLQKVRQMIRNRLDVVDIGRMHQVVIGLYREVLGDLDELISDEFCDDIRFSSRRSSHLSIVPGPGAPDFQNKISSKKISNQEFSDFSVTNHPEQLDINNFDIAGFDISKNITLNLDSSLKLDDQNEKSEDASTPRALSPSNPFFDNEHNAFSEVNGKNEEKEEITNKQINSKILSSSLINGNNSLDKIADKIDGCEKNPFISPPQQKNNFQQNTQSPSQPFNSGGTFRRQNSLQPERCSRRIAANHTKTGRGTAVSTLMLPTVPEFLTNRSQPSIRLRAQSMRKKKIVAALYRQEPVVVFVRLLDGHTVEVNCTSDQLVGAVFHTVSEHLYISEHLFFGLALLSRNGESIFLEERQHLEKWAPPGWKSGIGREQFILNFRFRFYPKKREFIKTSITTHQLYLQLRQDMLSGTLRFQPREKALEMAALALCVEYEGDQEFSSSTSNNLQGDYFNLENYLPGKFYDLKAGEILSVQKEIISLHGQFSKQLCRLEAKERFISLCLEETYYGSHFYRVHKIKPKGHQQQFLPDLRLLAIMPSGIGICREERNGAQRLFTSLHQWSNIRTLQFDKKRFLLGIIENGIAVDNIFYVDHHSKSGYLVRFAASQHGFMLKMRQWQGTLERVRAVQRHRDVAIDGSIEVISQQNHQSIDGLDSKQTHRRNGSQPQMGISAVNSCRQPDLVDLENKECNDADDESIYGQDAQKIFMVLERHPEFGLGLTLVDGAVNGVKGVYVKSVAAEGDGHKKGLLIGDCLLSINGISLLDRTRHDAVEIVQNCGGKVRLEVLRFPSISVVLSKEPLQSVINGLNSGRKPTNTHSVKNVKDDESQIVSARRRTSAPPENKNNDSLKNIENVKCVSTKKIEATNITNNNSKPNVSHRQRAVSDFGAISGMTLPTLKTDDILTLSTKNDPIRLNAIKPNRYRRHKTSVGFMETTMLESDEDEDISTDGGSSTITRSSLTDLESSRGEYIIKKMPSVTAMYGIENEDNNDEEKAENINIATKEKQNKINNGYQRANTIQSTSDVSKSSPFDAALQRFARQNTNNEVNNNNKPLLNLDWTNDLTTFEKPKNEESIPHSSKTTKQRGFDKFDEEVIVVTLNKNENTPIGLSLAKRVGYDGVYIRSIGPDNSLAAQDGTLRVGDQIVRVQGVELRNDESPLNVVKQLKNIIGPLKIHVKRRL